MDASLKAKWVEALRSGEYEQARCTLKKSNALCCINVGHVVKYGKPAAAWQLTCRVGDDIGLSLSESTALANLNDIEGKTFPEIADWIESHIPADSETTP